MLVTDRQGYYVDGTLGGGGHAEAMLECLQAPGTLIGIDADDDALQAASERLKKFGAQVHIVNNNFRNLPSVLSSFGIASVHGILLDLGVSSFQLDEPSKGFSFRTNDRLDMRMDRKQLIDARMVINTYEEQRLTELFRNYGEEQQARRIARAVVYVRREKMIETTGELASIVERTVGARFLTKTLARIFQAIRIEVNNELENLRVALHAGIDCLLPGGRLVVISYHSLEDRIVKETFREVSACTIPSGNKIQPDRPVQPVMKIITKKPVVASEQEQEMNPRSRSAKLRIAEKL